jgi:hypothetical protein
MLTIASLVNEVGVPLFCLLLFVAAWILEFVSSPISRCPVCGRSSHIPSYRDRCVRCFASSRPLSRWLRGESEDRL